MPIKYFFLIWILAIIEGRAAETGYTVYIHATSRMMIPYAQAVFWDSV
uniref:Uncharacterized protein n=1 Tax=Romanomermis culicivorax TaxID=13658 RepID=A0A915I9G9_ROMCU